MKIEIYRRDRCGEAKGLCVVIDVLRAFTTAAYAFDRGAQEITLVSSIEEALQMHREDPSLLLMGEEGGRPIAGFHYGNSPADIQRAPLRNCRMVQRTSAGTQGVVGCRHADRMLIASFVVAEATLRRILELSPSHLSFIVTGTEDGDEDLALAEYLKLRLLNQEGSSTPFLDRVRHSPEGRIFADPKIADFAQEDLELALQIDRFSFAMEVEECHGQQIATKV